jgi:hypothetical protein
MQTLEDLTIANTTSQFFLELMETAPSPYQLTARFTIRGLPPWENKAEATAEYLAKCVDAFVVPGKQTTIMDDGGACALFHHEYAEMTPADTVRKIRVSSEGQGRRPQSIVYTLTEKGIASSLSELRDRVETDYDISAGQVVFGMSPGRGYEHAQPAYYVDFSARRRFRPFSSSIDLLEPGAILVGWAYDELKEQVIPWYNALKAKYE